MDLHQLTVDFQECVLILLSAQAEGSFPGNRLIFCIDADLDQTHVEAAAALLGLHCDRMR